MSRDDWIAKSVHSKKNDQGHVSRFFQRVGALFKQASSDEHGDLSGRIIEVETTIDEVLDRLVRFKDKVKQEQDDELVKSLDSILNMLIRESLGVQKMVERPHEAALQVKAIKRYSEWLDKARRWSDLLDEEYDSSVVYRKIIEHTMEDFHLRIDRDVEVLQEYFINFMNNCNGDEQENEELRIKLESHLLPYFQKLVDLKTMADITSLELKEFSVWRTTADEARSKTFTKALYLIDEFGENVEQTNDDYTEEEILILQSQDRSGELDARVKMLEHRINELLLDIEQYPSEHSSMRDLAYKLETLEIEAHLLNSDLRLSQSQVESIEKVLECIASIKSST